MAEYPLPGFHFLVEQRGARVSFSEVSGLDVELEMAEYRGGAQPEFSKIKMPGLKKYSNITLKKGIFLGDNEFFNWWNTAALNLVERVDLTISLLNEQHAPVMVWKAKNAFLLKITGPSLNAGSNEVAVETAEIAHEGLTIEAIG
jgi:phage tail-like protein